MLAYLLRRLSQMIPTLAGVMLLVFFLFKYFGGDPAEVLGGQNASAEQIAAIRKQLGLDEPVWVQLWIFVKQIFTFDWGKSWATNEAISHLFANRLPNTLTVMIPILVLDVRLALPIAMWVVYRRGSLTDRTIMVSPPPSRCRSASWSTSSSASTCSALSRAGSQCRAGATASGPT